MADDRLALLRRYWDEVWRDGDVAVVDELFAERYIRHNSAGTATLTRAELKESIVQYQRVLHAPTTTIEAHAVDGDVVWLRATSCGANVETGGTQLLTWMVAYRFDGDRIAEGWIAALPDVDWRSPRA